MIQSPSTVLIVEDDPNIQKHFAAVLQKEGFKVLAASDAPGAIHQAREKQPDLILINMGLAGGGGELTIKRLKTLDTTKLSPILVFSDEDPSKVMRAAFLNGATDFISKQASEAELISTLRRHLVIK